MKFVDLSNKVFGRLTVIDRSENIGKYVAWRCVCVCGAECAVKSIHLTQATTRSCGCLQKEFASNSCKKRAKHGLSNSVEHKTWSGMIARCGQWPNCAGESRYISKGIKVCDEWLGESGFHNFISDMGLRPKGKNSIDRIDNSKGYYKENCRWATWVEQANNRDSTIRINGTSIYDIEKKTPLSVNKDLIVHRLRRGWTVEQAFSKGKDHSETMKEISAKPEVKRKRSIAQMAVKANPVFYVNEKVWFNSPKRASIFTGIGNQVIARSATKKTPVSQGPSKGALFLWRLDALAHGWSDDPSGAK